MTEPLTINLQSCSPHTVTLKFPQEQLEREFNDAYRKQAVQYYRRVSVYVLGVMVALSIAGLFIDFSVNDDAIQQLLWFAYIPLTVIAVACLSIRSLMPYSQLVVVMYVLLAGIVGIVFPQMQEEGFAAYYGHSYVMLVCFLLFPLSRLRLVHGLMLASLLIVVFLAVMGTTPGYTGDDMYRQSSWMIGATLFGMGVGYLIELNVRRWFLARKVIENSEQQLRRQHAQLLLSQEQLQLEKKLSDSLLLSILPGKIVERLKAEGKSIADGIVECTVLFSDLVGFTGMAQETGPRALVDILNEIFSGFDELSARFGLEKIKTIGDAYMVAGGVPEYSPGHAVAVADMALHMREFIANYNREKNLDLGIRIGIHTGPVIAGIIGTKKFTYDLWGDAVNMASRMESHGLPGKIQITGSTWLLLKKDFLIEERGIVNIKGKGDMKTYLLEGRKTS